MVSKYEIHWKRVKAGKYVMLPNGNYEIIGSGKTWHVYWYNLWDGRREQIAGCTSYAEAKRYAERHKEIMLDKAIKGFGRR